MKITAWRITKKKHLNSAFSGDGAKLFGGRWNPPGHPAIYASDSLSLAILEIIIHLDDDSDLNDFAAIPMNFDDANVLSLQENELPKNWSCLPISEQTQNIGKKWLEKNEHLLLKVPSSVVPHDSNFIINPLHPDFKTLVIGAPCPLQIDSRRSKKIH